MHTINRFNTALALALVAALGGCANMGPPGSTAGTGVGSQSYPVTGNAPSPHIYSGYGVLQAIERVQQPVATANTGIGGSSIGLGAVAGAVVGGIVGNQVGEGTGKTIATAIGVAGGAYAGHVLENRNRNDPEQTVSEDYRFTVRMEQGAYQVLTQTMTADFRVGDRVHIDNAGVLRRY
ncbi:MAG: glycine zipper 2TM domain-containing protein [Azoarcus sp.]|nr:glycine zipper 2TM domain-containing protein [Azoarcus sp.]